MKGLNRYTKINRNKAVEDIEFYEFYQMFDKGLTHTEIAKQLGITEKTVTRLVKELEKGL